VIHVPIQSKEIYDVIISILNKKIIRQLTIVNPYGDGQTSLLFKEFLNQLPTIDNDSVMKTFYDLKEKI
jgi:UDP-N-acetylglucosamine 2-epimerase